MIPSPLGLYPFSVLTLRTIVRSVCPFLAPFWTCHSVSFAFRGNLLFSGGRPLLSPYLSRSLQQGPGFPSSVLTLDIFLSSFVAPPGVSRCWRSRLRYFFGYGPLSFMFHETLQPAFVFFFYCSFEMAPSFLPIFFFPISIRFFKVSWGVKFF